MSRSLKASVQSILDGGQCYWLVVIHPNTVDTLLAGLSSFPNNIKVAFGTLSTYSLAGYDVQTERLVDISDIDLSIAPMEEHIAKTNDTKITIENKDRNFDPFEYLGRKCEIYFGSGSTMSEATSDLFYTGKIFDGNIVNDNIVLNIRGMMQLMNKPVGSKLPDDVSEKYKGKIIPITHGDWSDYYAYAPTVLNRPDDKAPDMLCDTQAWDSVDGLYVYDEDADRGYQVSESDHYTIDADNIKISFLATGSTQLTRDSGDRQSDDVLYVLDATDIINAYDTGVSPDPTIIKVDNELMLVTKKPVISTVVKVLRGYMGTDIKQHTSASTVYIVSDDIASLGFRVYGRFFAEGVAGMHVYNDWDGGTNQLYAPDPQSDHSFDKLIDKERTTYLEMKKTYHAYQTGVGETNNNLYAIDLKFPKTSLRGEVISQYVLAKCECGVKVNPANPSLTWYGRVYIYLTDAETDYFATLADALQQNPTYGAPEVTDSFDNLGLGGWSTMPVPGANMIADISDLPGSDYNIDFDALVLLQWGDTIDVRFRFNMIGFGITFVVDPSDYFFWVRGTARVYPAGYFNGVAGNLIENPSSIIEDIVRNDVDGLSSSDMDETSFDTFYTDRLSWKFAGSIYSGNN